MREILIHAFDDPLPSKHVQLFPVTSKTSRKYDVRADRASLSKRNLVAVENLFSKSSSRYEICSLECTWTKSRAGHSLQNPFRKNVHVARNLRYHKRREIRHEKELSYEIKFRTSNVQAQAQSHIGGKNILFLEGKCFILSLLLFHTFRARHCDSLISVSTQPLLFHLTCVHGAQL